MRDDAVANQIERDGIDVLIDLGGHTAGNRLLVFARRPAPLLLGHMVGSGATTGLEVMDGYFTDWRLAPAGSEENFSEPLIRLPRFPLVYAPPPGMPAVAPLPAVRNGHITFGCFSRLVRINDGVLDTWATLLKAIPSARLVLNTKPFQEASTVAAWQKSFAARGIAADRVDLIYTSPQPTTWAAYGNIDIALDPFPHNAGTTTIEALWMGVPVLTLADRPPVGRFGASILGAVGLDNWIAGDADDYVSKGQAAATDIAALSELRATLRDRFNRSPLRNASTLVTAMEAAIRELWADICVRVESEHIQSDSLRQARRAN
jgi:predicted O-linked N-acetylglucosamine transferase (SPINDLY family)